MAKSRVWYAGAAGVAEQPDGRDRNRAGVLSKVGLPVTPAQMGVKDGIDDKIHAVAKATCAEGETIHNMPFPVTPESVHAAILTADLLGQQWLAR